MPSFEIPVVLTIRLRHWAASWPYSKMITVAKMGASIHDEIKMTSADSVRSARSLKCSKVLRSVSTCHRVTMTDRQLTLDLIPRQDQVFDKTEKSNGQKG